MHHVPLSHKRHTTDSHKAQRAARTWHALDNFSDTPHAHTLLSLRRRSSWLAGAKKKTAETKASERLVPLLLEHEHARSPIFPRRATAADDERLCAGQCTPASSDAALEVVPVQLEERLVRGVVLRAHVRELLTLPLRREHGLAILPLFHGVTLRWKRCPHAKAQAQWPMWSSHPAPLIVRRYAEQVLPVIDNLRSAKTSASVRTICVSRVLRAQQRAVRIEEVQ